MLTILSKRGLLLLGLTTAASATNEGIDKTILGSRTPKLIISTEKMKGTMKLIKFLKKLGLLTKVFSETIENESKEKKVRFLGMLLGTLAVSLLRNFSAGTDAIRVGNRVIGAHEGANTEGQDFNFALFLDSF